jgi:hypothetical protein
MIKAVNLIFSFIIIKFNLIKLCLNCSTSIINGSATDPIITSWIKSTGYYNGSTGYTSGSTTWNNVWKISYSSSYVYVYTNSLPSYSVGPWYANPNTPSSQSAVFKFSRLRTTNGSTANSLGAIGALTNGVFIYNANDG